MGQFTVYRNKSPRTKALYPLLLDVQTDLLDALGTRVVIPLSQDKSFVRRPIRNLMPVITVEGAAYVAVTPQLAGIQNSELGQRVSEIPEQRDAIVAAIEFMITGV